MGLLEAVVESSLAQLPDAEWDALVLRVRGPRRDYPAKRARKPKPANGGGNTQRTDREG